MRKFARIQDGVVFEIVEIPDDAKIEDHFHQDLMFVATKSDVELGWLWDGKKLSPPPIEPEGSEA